jgi:branched-subunit amino acid aminotransferase/4-amino-4-deoxychorismate lyase
LADPGTVLRFTAAGLIDPGDAPAAPLLVADSWLVDDGVVRAQDAHWARFGASCAAAGADPAQVDAFRRAATVAIPDAGRWFPRVELTAHGLGFRLRPAPPAAELAVVTAGPAGDPRRAPRVKGPDLALLLVMREHARRQGADELLLCDEAGALREGALSSLLWWEGEALCTTPGEHTLPGITRGLLLDLAREREVEVRVRSPLPAELAGREVWLTSALHGIRAVSGWVAPAQSAGAPLRAAAWRDLLRGAGASG